MAVRRSGHDLATRTISEPAQTGPSPKFRPFSGRHHVNHAFFGNATPTGTRPVQPPRQRWRTGQ